MGGLGSGSGYRWNTRTTTEQVRRLDIRYLRQQGWLQPGAAGRLEWHCGGSASGSIGFQVESEYLLLNYRYRESGQEWRDTEEFVRFDRTPCNYGGERLWFRCPHCALRVALLYSVRARFLCRHCCALPYGSQSEGPRDRWMRIARKIRRRLGASENLFDTVWSKPKGMHWATFERLRGQEQQLNNAAVFAMARSLKIDV